MQHGSKTPKRYKYFFLRVPFGFRVQEPCESGGGCPGLSVPNRQESLCGRNATLNELPIGMFYHYFYERSLFFFLFFFSFSWLLLLP